MDSFFKSRPLEKIAGKAIMSTKMLIKISHFKADEDEHTTWSVCLIVYIWIRHGKAENNIPLDLNWFSSEKGFRNFKIIMY